MTSGRRFKLGLLIGLAIAVATSLPGSSAIPLLASSLNKNRTSARPILAASNEQLPSPPVSPDMVENAGWWATVQEDIRQSEYHVTWQDQTYLPDLPAAYQAPNRAHNLRTYFAPAGIRVLPRPEDTSSWQWGLTLTGYGYAGDLRPVAAAELVAEGNRIEYHRGGPAQDLTEWYVNDERGLEQGFTLTAPPPSEIPDPESEIILELALTGDLTPHLTADETSIEFTTPGGARVLRYSDLYVYDAVGRSLPAHLSYAAEPDTPRRMKHAIRINVDATRAVYPLTIDPLATSPNWSVEGNQVNAQLGWSVGTAGDVNGDGYADLVVGARAYDGGQTNEGRAYVYHGSASGLSTGAAWAVECDQGYCEYGYSVGTAGDVNGDGYADLVVGAVGFSGDQEAEGRAYVYHGSASGLDSSAAWWTESNQASAYLGNSVGTAGDVNGDGYADVVIGARWYDGGQQREGKVFVYHGSALGLGSSPAWQGEGDNVGALYGDSVGTAGDVNGDGYADLVVGAFLYSGEYGDEGKAYVYHGSASGLAKDPAWAVTGNQACAPEGDGSDCAWYADSVGTAGDVNGDGYADLVVGASGYDGGQVDSGRVFVYYGSKFGLSVTPGWTADSDQSGIQFGASVGTAGDVNGDGFADIVVGARYYNGGQEKEGRVYVYYGSAFGLGTSAAWMIDGNQAGAELGFSVSTAGDVNGDGYADLVVGAPYYDDEQQDKGRAYVYHGSSSGLGALTDWRADSDEARAWFGISAGTAGDVNGDGYADIIVGAMYYGIYDVGRAFVYYGSADGPSNMPNWSAQGENDNALFGLSVGTAGDVNGDGFADVIIGVPGEDGQYNMGRAYVYHGSASGLGSTPNWTGKGDQAESAFGISVDTAGDVNGDGYADVIVGAPGYSGRYPGEGRAYVFYGSASGLSITTDWTAESNQADTGFAGAVGTAGDVNGDGYADVIVGADLYDGGQENEGRAYVYYGSASGLSTTATWTAESDQAHANLGTSVGTAGDVNGDGYADVIVGAPAYDGGQENEGRAYVYHGSVSGLSLMADWTVESNQSGARFGSSVGTAGDVNGDSYADVIVGAPAYDGGQSWEGRAYVYHGSVSGLSTVPAWTAESNQVDAGSASAVGMAGDVNGDGYADVIVGAPWYDVIDQGWQLWDGGRAYVYHGSLSGLNKVVPWTAESDQPFAQFSGSMDTAGDVNGDGYADVIVGAPYYDGGQEKEGRAYVFHGSASGLSMTAAWTFESNQAQARLGISVSTTGDVNGDGYADVIVGADGYDDGQTDEGRAYVFNGSMSGLGKAPNWTADVNQAGAGFGRSVSAAGDVNGDGYADVVVGAPYYDNGQEDEGRAIVYYGSASGLSTFTAWTAESNQSGGTLGHSVGTAGDVNGDGYTDIILGAPSYDGDYVDGGRAVVYYGSASGLSTVSGWAANGYQAGASLGWSAGTAGDVNGDGYADVIIGAPRHDVSSAITDTGRVYVCYGSAVGLRPSAAWTVESDQAEAWFGHSVSTAGDVNGDGYADIVVGAPGCDGTQIDQGRVSVYHGRQGGLTTGAADGMAESDQANAQFGYSVSAAGDVNGDGYADLIVGAPYYDNGQTDEGQAFLYYGNGGPGLSLKPRQRRSDNSAPIAHLGRSEDLAFRLSALGHTPFGRGKVKLEWEVKPLGTPFDGNHTGQSSTWIDTGTAGVEIDERVGILWPNTPYHWRVRLLYHPATSPFQQHSRWVAMTWNGWNEQDFRTADRAFIHLPVLLNSYHICDADYEENDHWLQACGPLLPGKTYLAYPDDKEDYYYFELQSNAEVTVQVDNYAPTSSNGQLQLWGPASDDTRGELVAAYLKPGATSMSLGPRILGPGRYYVRVRTDGAYGNSSLYTLIVTY